MKKFLRLFVSTYFAGSLAASAVQTERILIDSFQEWSEGRPEGVAIREPGLIVPAPAFEEWADLKTSVIWSGAVEPSGSLLLAVGKPGSVWRLQGSGKLQQLTSFTEPDVYAVASGPKGEVYAAPSPGGKIFRLGAKGQFEEYYQTGEEFVWDLKVSPGGVLFAATGPKGKIHRISGKGQGEVWFDADEPHIRRLAFDGSGNLLAGTAGKGLLYRILARDQGVVLLESGRDEIAGIAVDGDGTVVVAATSGVGGGGGSGGGDRPRSLRPVAPPEGSPGSPSILVPEAARAASAASTPKGTTDIYAIRGDLFPHKIREVKDDIVSLAAVGRTVYGASASDGRIYQIINGNELALMGEIGGRSVVGLLARDTSLYALTQGQSQVWRGNAKASTGGDYVSKVMDTKVFARWGAMRVMGEGDWSVRTRSGNTSEADKSWYPWVPLDGGRVASPAARYLQFEIRLGRGQVEQVEMFYLPQNLPPKIEALRVLGPDVAFEPMPQPAPPPQPQTADQLAKGGEGMNVPPPRFQPAMVRGARSVAWQASDPNGDPLEYTVELGKEGESRWERLDEELEQPVFSWDTSGWSDGLYRLRITASDAAGNSKERTLKTEKVTEAFTIDHTPPTGRVVRKTREEVEIEVSDRTSLLLAAYVSGNGHDFRPLLPLDGLNDSPREVYRIPRKEGQTLYFRAEDEHGNVVGLRVIPD
jgi:hypothetical protein